MQHALVPTLHSTQSAPNVPGGQTHASGVVAPLDVVVVLPGHGWQVSVVPMLALPLGVGSPLCQVPAGQMVHLLVPDAAP